ncbi:MAG: LytTR family DNA-binding domain-containing protein [Maritimibacter sp.]
MLHFFGLDDVKESPVAPFDYSLHRPDTLHAIQPFVGHVSYPTREFGWILTKPRMIAYVAFNVLLYVFIDALSLQEIIGFWNSVIFWCITLPFYFVTWNLAAYGAARLQHRFKLGAIFLPFIGAFVFMCAAVQGTAQIALFNGVTFREAIEPWFLFSGYVVTLLLELLFFTIISPYLVRIYFPHWETPQSASREILVGEMAFALSDILFLRANKHFVEIGLTSGTVTSMRARLVDLVGQTKPHEGVMAHRSYWIARTGIKAIHPGPKSDEIEVLNGDRMSVAAPRVAEVRAWASTHGVPIWHEDTAQADAG